MRNRSRLRREPEPAKKRRPVLMYCVVTAVALAILAGNIQFAPGIFAYAMEGDKDVLRTEDRSDAPAAAQETGLETVEPSAQPTEAAEQSQPPEEQAAGDVQPAEAPENTSEPQGGLSKIGSPLPAVKQEIPTPEGYIDLIAALQKDARAEVKDAAQALAIAKEKVAGYYGADAAAIDWHKPETLNYDPNVGKLWEVIGEHPLNKKDILVYSLRISAKTGAILNAGLTYDFGSTPGQTEAQATDEQNARWTQEALSYLDKHGLISGAKVVNTMLEPDIRKAGGAYRARIWAILENGIMANVGVNDDNGEIAVQYFSYCPVWENPQ